MTRYISDRVPSYFFVHGKYNAGVFVRLSESYTRLASCSWYGSTNVCPVQNILHKLMLTSVWYRYMCVFALRYINNRNILRVGVGYWSVISIDKDKWEWGRKEGNQLCLSLSDLLPYNEEMYFTVLHFCWKGEEKCMTVFLSTYAWLPRTCIYFTYLSLLDYDMAVVILLSVNNACTNMRETSTWSVCRLTTLSACQKENGTNQVGSEMKD